MVIEEFLDGEEASFISMVDGRTALPMATSQDHKRVGDADTGPNTGGMGAYSPAPVVTPEVHARVMREVVNPTVQGMIADGDFGRARLRIELEHFVRLPMSGAVTFNIRTFMASLEDVKRIPEWAGQLATVIETLGEDIAAYKGFLDYRDNVVAYLRGQSRP